MRFYLALQVETDHKLKTDEADSPISTTVAFVTVGNIDYDARG